jgi:hypothetical protein
MRGGFCNFMVCFPPIFSKKRLTKFLACQESRFTVVERVTTQPEGVSEEKEG